MRKIIVIFISLLILFILPGCEKNNEDDLSSQLENLEKENELLKSELEKVTRERDKLKAEKEELEDNINDTNEELVLVEVIDKINKPKDVDNWILDDSVVFHISITNNYKKDIREIQGVLDIKNTSGVNILRLDTDFTGHIIKSGERFINKDTVLKINQYINEDKRLYNSNHGDLNYTYTIKQIIFSDGTTE